MKLAFEHGRNVYAQILVVRLACSGGNGTMLGASANLVAIGIAEREGYPISFFEFMKVGFVYMLISVGIANLWLLLFYS